MKTVTIQYGPANTITKQVDNYTSVRNLIENPNIKASLGFGTNVQVLDDYRRAVNLDTYVTDGATYTLETVANQKAANGPTVTISYGPANSVTRQFNEGATVGDVLKDTNLRAVLGFGENVQALIDRTPMSPTTSLNDGDEVNLEVVANQKAA